MSFGYTELHYQEGGPCEAEVKLFLRLSLKVKAAHSKYAGIQLSHCCIARKTQPFILYFDTLHLIHLKPDDYLKLSLQDPKSSHSTHYPAVQIK
jgi:hypothetical protein